VDVEVTFTVKSDISEFTPDPYRTSADYYRYYFNPYFVHQPEMTEFIANQTQPRFFPLTPGQIWISDEILSDETTHKAVKDKGYTLSMQEVSLKGVGDRVKVHLLVKA
jgi:hypothetical protein